MGAVRPTLVIHTAAATDVERSEREPEWAWRLNESMAGEVAAAARSAGARLLHISTDAVFEGETDGHDEHDPTNPRSVYAASKLAGERSVLAAYPAATVVRTTIYGWNALPKQSLAEWFLARLRRGESTPGFADVTMSPILVNDLAGALLAIADRPSPGVLHVCGRECVTKADFGRRVAAVFGCDAALVQSTSIADSPLVAPRGHRQCLRVDRAEGLIGQALPGVDDGLERFRRLEEAGHRRRLRDLVEVN